MNYQILVNKENLLTRDYIPSNLVEYYEYNGEKIDPNHKTLVEQKTLESFFKMKNKAREFGYEIIIDSCYRSYDYQQQVLNRFIEEIGEEAYSRVALPGTSEHQTGLALDISFYRDGQYVEKFTDEEPEIKWIMANAHLFGFILRYPKGKESITGYNYECWHYRYVGEELAMYMKENGIDTLEEYYSKEYKKIVLS